MGVICSAFRLSPEAIANPQGAFFFEDPAILRNSLLSGPGPGLPTPSPLSVSQAGPGGMRAQPQRL
jgi:hypothetical protein